MNWLLIAILQLVPILLILYYWRIRRQLTYWERMGIPGPKPDFWKGNVFVWIFNSLGRGMTEVDTECFGKFGKLWGSYHGRNPVLYIADPLLVKQIMIRDFGSFMNRAPYPKFRSEVDRRSLFNSESGNWKRLRAITSPSFTSGKLRSMNGLMGQCVDKLVVYLDKITKETGSAEINTKKVLMGFTIDVIASTAFATDTDSNGDRAKENIFIIEAGKRFLFLRSQLILAAALPKWLRKLTYWAVPPAEIEKEKTFFSELATEIIRQRRANPDVKRNDLVQLMMDASVSERDVNNADFEELTATDDQDDDFTKPSNGASPKTSITKSLEDIEIIASSVLFFQAGFETTASTLTHSLFELAMNLDVQDRLCAEVNNATEGMDLDSSEYHDKVVNGIPYLEAVMKETLRKYPPLGRLERRCGVDGYELGGVPLFKGQLVQVSAYVIHHNSEFYPEPERFNPDRFLPENKHLLVPYTYMPFGQGPRNCIGMRFAYQEIKLCLAKIIPKFRFEPTVGTPKVLELGKIVFSTAKTFPLKVSRRL